MSKNVKYLKKWIIGIVTSVIITVLSSTITAAIKNISLIDSFIWLVKTIKDFFVFILTYRIAVYKILMIILAICFLLYILVKILQIKDSIERWRSYTKDIYGEWCIKWSYSRNNKIINIRPYCSCGCDLIKTTANCDYEDYEYLKCPNCRKTYPCPFREDMDAMEALIIYRINNDKYPKKITKE